MYLAIKKHTTNEIKKWVFITHPTFLFVNVISIYIPRHPKICHLTLLSFTNQNISCCQVTMDDLAYETIHTKVNNVKEEENGGKQAERKKNSSREMGI